MKPHLLSLLALAAGLAAAAFAADEKEKDTKVTSRDALNARILEEAAKKQAASPAAPAPADPAAKSTKAAPPAAAAKQSKPKDAAAEKAKSEPATVLPKVEVNRSRINEIDGKIIEQEKQIAQEKVNTKPTELDKALNNPKVSKALSIFGGESSSQRATVASERVKIMQEERDLLEAMKAAKTKEEKASLQQELDALRAYRRELEKSLR
jgi:hypothetical protein